MILIDTGPLVALFDPRDKWHTLCRKELRSIREPLYTTLPALTEAFHIMDPASIGSRRLMDFVASEKLGVIFSDNSGLARAFELMQRYSDHPMDLADASIIVAAEALQIRKIFTLDRRDFETYRIRRGHRHYPAEILP